ncbi:roadblock/LC7 domain-containing protein [Streptomyces bacillaris]|uniref:roadblock/LC7 domain-containing protein n=1 Tax=Streptomyces bacillaris TaxID=68179 RepID=UPI003460404A
MTVDLPLYEEELKLLQDNLHKLHVDANAKAVFLFSKNGQQLAAAGDVERFDTTSLASLTAGSVTADGLAKLISERQFSTLLHEGQQDHVHLSVVANDAILAIIFDTRSSLGLVRTRANRINGELVKIFATSRQKSDAGTGAAEVAELTDDEIKALFAA